MPPALGAAHGPWTTQDPTTTAQPTRLPLEPQSDRSASHQDETDSGLTRRASKRPRPAHTAGKPPSPSSRPCRPCVPNPADGGPDVAPVGPLGWRPRPAPRVAPADSTASSERV